MDIVPKAVAIPKSTEKLEKGKYGPVFPKTPACYGFTIVANVKPGRADTMRSYGERLAKALESKVEDGARRFLAASRRMANSPSYRLQWCGSTSRLRVSRSPTWLPS